MVHRKPDRGSEHNTGLESPDQLYKLLRMYFMNTARKPRGWALEVKMVKVVVVKEVVEAVDVAVATCIDLALEGGGEGGG
jgi:hypothetical protein